MKRILITSTDMMMIQFLAPHVRFLCRQDFQVELACSDVGGRMKDVRNALGSIVTAIHTIRLERSPARPGNLLGILDMRRLLMHNRYDIIWTNEPVMGAVTRLAAARARRAGTKVLYLCHGFHFYKGAGLLRWMLFYPAEWFLSRFCDCIVTINHQDEKHAEGLQAPRVEYIHGIGMDSGRMCPSGKSPDIRAQLSLPGDAFLLLSVGELNKNKNHRVILKAMTLISNPSVHYILCGTGPLREQLTALASGLGLTDRVHFLGYRTDIMEICSQADVFLLPSYREGLSVASLEAMYCGLPLITSNVRGAEDYLQDGVSGFLRHADDAAGFAEAIRMLLEDSELRLRCGLHNRRAVIPYTVENVQQELLDILTAL